MSTRQPDDNLLDLYLDGLLPADQRLAFERRLESDPALRGRVEEQQRINGALGRLFQPPPPRLPVAAPRIAEIEPATVSLPARRPWWPRLAVAAVLLVGLLGVAFALRTRAPATPDYPDLPWRSVEMVYRIEVQKGMKPLWYCAPGPEFERTFRDNLGQPLQLRSQLPVGLSMMGLSYSNTFSKKTVYMLARVNGTPVIVFVDRAERDNRPTVSRESGLHLYRRQAGNLVMYEVSPLDSAAFLDQLYVP